MNFEIFEDPQEGIQENPVEEESPEERYVRRKREISRNIPIELRSILKCWCPKSLGHPDIVQTVLGRYDPLDIRNHWKDDDLFSITSKRHHTIIVQYSEERAAFEAAREINMLSRGVKTIQLYQLVDFLIDVEVRHAMFGTGFTTLLLSGTRSFYSVGKDGEPSEEEDITKIFGSFGQFLDIDFFKIEFLSRGVICAVRYAYVSQAYAAKLYLHGYEFSEGFRLSVEICDSRKEREIMKSIKLKIIDYFDENKYVHSHLGSE